MRWVILLLSLVLSTPAYAIIVVGTGGSGTPGETCATQSYDVEFTTSNTYSSFQTSEERGQSWKAGVSGKLYSISFERTNNTNDASSIDIRIGSSTNLSSTYLVAFTCAISDPGGWKECVIPEADRPSLTASTTYYVLFRISSGYGVWPINRDSAQSYADGTAYYDQDKDWVGTASSNDLPFKTRMCD